MNMRYLVFILLSFLLMPFALSQRVDTLIEQNGNTFQVIETEYDQNDQITKVTYKSKLEGALDNPDGRAVLFMRGLSIDSYGDDYYAITDSVKNYYPPGYIKSEDFHFPSKIHLEYYYDKNLNIEYVEETVMRRKVYLLGDIGLDDVFYTLKGRIGTKNYVIVEIENRSPVGQEIYFSDNIGEWTSDLIKLEALEKRKMDLLLDIDTNDILKTIYLFQDSISVGSINIQILGYDLNLNDFVKHASRALKFDFQNKETISLFLDGKEKLINIYKDNQVLKESVPKIVNVIDLNQLTQGEYLLEIVDLGNGEKKYCKILK